MLFCMPRTMRHRVAVMRGRHWQSRFIPWLEGPESYSYSDHPLLRQAGVPQPRLV
jgi:hypothetical protein